MNVLTYNPDALTKYTVIPLGRACECRATRVDFAVAGWLNRFPGGEIVLYIKDPNGEMYLGTITTADGVTSWVLRETDTKVPGYGSLELALIGVNGEKKLSAVATTKLEASLVESDGDAEYMQPWIEQAAEIQANTEGAARIAATHAGTATQAASNAVEAADAADNAAARAEAAADVADDAAQAAADAAKEAEAAEDSAAAHAEDAADSAQGAAAAESTAAGHVQETLAAREDAAAWAEAAARCANESAESADKALAAAAMLEQAGRGAPAIECAVSGDVAVVTDAAARDAVAVVSTIAAVQGGTGDPSPDNVRPIVGWSAVGLYHGAAYHAGVAAELTADMIAALPEVVFGGTLDWVSGVLTVTHIVHEAQNLTWRASSQMAGRYVSACMQSEVVACTHYPLGRVADAGCIFRNTADQIGFNTDIATLDEWNAWLTAQQDAGTPVRILIGQIPDRLRTIQLTPQQLTMLEGGNALWSDTGSTSVRYIADTKTYIDNAIATLAAAVLDT